MAKRSKLFTASALLVVGVLIAWQTLPIGPRRLLVENYGLVKVGMSQAQVESLLGGPPGNFGRNAGGGAVMTLEGHTGPTGSIERIWCDDHNRFEIYFDASGHVVGHHERARYEQLRRDGFVSRLRQKLGL